MNDHFQPRRYFVKHRTSYHYSDPVLRCQQRGFLNFRSTRFQSVLAHRVVINPEPVRSDEHRDCFGNLSSYVEIHMPHTELEIVKEGIIDVAREPVNVDALNQWTLASASRAIQHNTSHAKDRAMYGLPSNLVQIPRRLKDYTDSILADDLGFGDAICEVTHNIYRDFAYKPGTTSIRTTVDELLDLRGGVCQDFAHLGIAILRQYGIPAKYVSGYIETIPPPGKPKLEGSDASHAWLAAMAPNGKWIHLDPTNNQFVDCRYVITAWGRDFGDASPLRGIIETDAATSRMSVGVDMLQMTEDVPHVSVTGISMPTD